MARVVILGAGISGHTAALHLRRRLGRNHEVVMVTPNSKWNWIPSNIWVGVGKMTAEDVTFPLAPIYKRKGITFHQALATELHPEGSDTIDQPYVTVRYTDPKRFDEVDTITYDYLIKRDRAQAELRRDAGPRARRQHGLGLHAGARGTGVGGARGRHRQDAPRPAPAHRRGRRARHVHL